MEKLIFKDFIIRTIEPKDNVEIASIIRACLVEFKANKPGTVFFDPTTDNLFELFKKEGSLYYVVEKDNKLVGGAGIYPTINLPIGVVEIVKIYIIPQARKFGLGSFLMQHLFKEAKKLNYSSVYLETMPELSAAVNLYYQIGFKKINQPMGNSGHCGCDIWMEKKLS